MTITELHINSYGQLSDFHARDLGHPVVCILGSNEAGKSTMFSYIESMLFGFSPAKCARHPYTSASTGIIKGSMSYITHDNELATVTRAMDSDVSGRVDVGHGLFHRPHDIANASLPTLVGIDRQIYREVYAVSLYDLVELEESTWTSATDGILGNLGLQHYKSPAQVVSELTKEANSLWRPDRVGKPRSKQLAAKITELKRKIAASEAREDTLRNMEEEKETLISNINLLRSQVHVLGSDLTFSRKSFPVVQLSRKIEQCTLASQNVADLDHLPDKPATFLTESASELADIDNELQGLQGELATMPTASQENVRADEQLLESESELLKWQGRVTDAEVIASRLHDHVGQLQRIENRIVSATAEMGVGHSDQTMEAIRLLDVSDLGQLANQLDLKKARAREIEMERDSIADRSNSASMILAWSVVILVGAVATLMAITNASLDRFLVFFGLMVMVFGGYGIWKALARRKALASRMSALSAELDENSITRLRSEFYGLCSSFLAPDHSIGSFKELGSRVAAVKSLDSEFQSLNLKTRDLEIALEEERKSFKTFAESYGVVAEGSASDAFNYFSSKVSEARSRRRSEQEITRRRERLLQDAARLEKRREQLISRRGKVETELRQLGANSVDAGLELLRSRREARDLLALHQTTRDNDFPDWESVLSVADSKNGSLLDEVAQEKADNEIKRLTSALRDKEIRLAKLTEKSEALSAQANTLGLKSELSRTQSQMDDLRFKRDRLLLMANLIEESEIAFRERVEPELLESAGGYINAITNGKYSDLLVDQDGVICLRDSKGLVHQVDDPISQGTQDQVFLSLRFAVADRLDQGLERIPLTLDEVFVNWDERRRHNGYSVLRNVSERRQVFFFTCHEWLADELRTALGARVLSLQ